MLVGDGIIAFCMLHAASDESIGLGIEANLVARPGRLESHDDPGITLDNNATELHGLAVWSSCRSEHVGHLLDDAPVDENTTRLGAPTAWTPVPVRKPTPAALRAAADRHSPHGTRSSTATFAQAP